MEWRSTHMASIFVLYVVFHDLKYYCRTNPLHRKSPSKLWLATTLRPNDNNPYLGTGTSHLQRPLSIGRHHQQRSMGGSLCWIIMGPDNHLALYLINDRGMCIICTFFHLIDLLKLLSFNSFERYLLTCVHELEPVAIILWKLTSSWSFF